MLRSCLVALALATLGLLPVGVVSLVAILVTIPAAFLLAKQRYVLGFVVAFLPAAAVAIAWAAILVAFLRWDAMGLPSSWLALPAWMAAFGAAQMPFGLLARSQKLAPHDEMRRAAFGWAWLVAAVAFTVFGLVPGSLPALLSLGRSAL